MSKEQFILVSVLLEMFLEAGINTERKIIIDTPDSTEDYVCDRDCDNCPLNAVPCEFELCKSWHECQLCCPCEANCDGRGLDE